MQVTISHKVYSAVEIEDLQVLQICMHCTAHTVEKKNIDAH